MARDQWLADVSAGRISHRTLRFQVDFEGDPTSDHCEGRPGKFPEGLSSLEKVRLVREAFDYYIEAWKESRSPAHRVAVPPVAPGQRPPDTKPVVVSNKPRLGLRRSSSAE